MMIHSSWFDIIITIIIITITITITITNHTSSGSRRLTEMLHS